MKKAAKNVVTREWHNKKAGREAAGMKTDAAIGSGLRYVLGVECFKTFFHASIVDTKELVLSSGHIDEVRFPLRTFLVQELVDRLVSRGFFQIGTDDLEKGLAKV